MTLTVQDVYVAHLQTGCKAVRQLHRLQACTLAGEVGERALCGVLTLNPSPKAHAAVHEPFHAIAGFLWNPRGKNIAIAVWDSGAGLCGDFQNVEEAKFKHGRPGGSDAEQNAEYVSAFEAVGLTKDPLAVDSQSSKALYRPRLEAALLRLFRLPRYVNVALKLAQMVFERGYVSHEEVTAVIEENFRRAQTPNPQPSMDCGEPAPEVCPDPGAEAGKVSKNHRRLGTEWAKGADSERVAAEGNPGNVASAQAGSTCNRMDSNT